MQNFQFANPTQIIFGKGQIEQLTAKIPVGSKVFILYGGGSAQKTGLLGTVKDTLKGYQVGEFGGIEPNPTYETLMKAVEIIRKENYDFLLAVGGGSVIDGTKFIAAAVPYLQGDPWEIVRDWLDVKSALPFGVVLTLPATGSEMNDGAVITRKEIQAKLPFMSKAVFPRFSILDPIYTYTLPTKQISNGVVDSFIHVMEQYLTYPAEGKVQDRFSEGLLLTLIEEGPKALQEKENYDVRANLMWVASLALNGLIGSGVPQDWATHMIGHEITVLYGLDHAQTLAIVLPSLLEVMKEEKQAKLLQYGERVWNLSKDMPVEEKAIAAIERTRNFFETMGVKTRLADYGLGQDVIEPIIANLEAHGMVELGEKGLVTPAIVRSILSKSL